MDSDLPKISIVTPSFNSAQFIRDAIESVLKQNYPNFEHIIIDGGSTDGTIEILKKYPHLKWISEPDKGQSDALNKGFKLSSGDWILWLNSDDRLADNSINVYIKHIKKYHNYDMFYGHTNFIDSNNQKIRTVYQISYSYRLTSFRLYIPPSTGTIFRKEALQKNPLDIEFHYIMDVVWFLRYGKLIRSKLINRILSEFRISNNKTGLQIVTGKRPERHIKEIYLSQKFYPPYVQNESCLLYKFLHVFIKFEYYFKKIFIYLIYKVFN